MYVDVHLINMWNCDLVFGFTILVLSPRLMGHTGVKQLIVINSCIPDCNVAAVFPNFKWGFPFSVICENSSEEGGRVCVCVQIETSSMG